MSVSLRKRGLCELSGASKRVGTVTPDALRAAVALDLAENQLTTLQKPFQLSTFSTPLTKQDARSHLMGQARTTPATVSQSNGERNEEEDQRSALDDMHALLYLSVAHNMIRSLIGVGATSDTLTVLIAPHNQLESVQGLERCVHLRYVDLRHNRLRSLAGLPTGTWVPGPTTTAPIPVSSPQHVDAGARGDAFTHGPNPKSTTLKPLTRHITPTSKSAQVAAADVHDEVSPPFEPGTGGIVEDGIVLLLSNNKLKGRALTVLSSAPPPVQDDEGNALIPAPPAWASFICVLDLSANPLEDVGDIERLLRAPHLTQLSEVNLNYTPFLLNGSLANALLTATAAGLVEWPVPPPLSTRVELFPDISTEARAAHSVIAGKAPSAAAAALSKADEAAERADATRHASLLCRLASACASALWRPDSVSPSGTASRASGGPQRPRGPRTVRLLGAAPTIEFVLEAMASTAAAPSGAANHTPTQLSRSRQAASPSILVTPPPLWTPPEKEQRASPVPPLVAHTLPRHDEGSCLSPGTEWTRDERDARQTTPTTNADDVEGVNQSLSGEARVTALLHTSTWSANEADSSVGYVIFKGHTQGEALASSSLTPSHTTRASRSGPRRTQADERSDRSRTAASTPAPPPPAVPEAEMSSIAESGSGLSSIDGSPLRPSALGASATAAAPSAGGRPHSGAPLEVQLSVLLAENQALRRRNAELEARHRAHKQAAAQQKISIEILQEELLSTRRAAGAGKGAAVKDKAEAQRLRNRVSALEKELAKAYGTVSAARLASTVP